MMNKPDKLGANGEVDWQRLRQTLRWSEGFWVTFVFTVSSDVADVLLERIGIEAVDLGSSLEVVQPRSLQELERLPTRLLGRAGASGAMVWWRMLTPGRDWAQKLGECLMRLNERRELLTRRLGAPFIIVLRPEHKPIVRDLAPDLWSIRTLSFDFAPQRRVNADVYRFSPRPDGDGDVGDVGLLEDPIGELFALRRGADLEGVLRAFDRLENAGRLHTKAHLKVLIRWSEGLLEQKDHAFALEKACLAEELASELDPSQLPSIQILKARALLGCGDDNQALPMWKSAVRLLGTSEQEAAAGWLLREGWELYLSTEQAMDEGLRRMKLIRAERIFGVLDEHMTAFTEDIGGISWRWSVLTGLGLCLYMQKRFEDAVPVLLGLWEGSDATQPLVLLNVKPQNEGYIKERVYGVLCHSMIHLGDIERALVFGTLLMYLQNAHLNTVKALNATAVVVDLASALNRDDLLQILEERWLLLWGGYLARQEPDFVDLAMAVNVLLILGRASTEHARRRSLVLEALGYARRLYEERAQPAAFLRKTLEQAAELLPEEAEALQRELEHLDSQTPS